MIDTDSLRDCLQRHEASAFAVKLIDAVEQRISDPNHGDLARWTEALNNLPAAQASAIDLNQGAVAVGRQSDLTPEKHEKLVDSLKALSPWRKGPYRLFDTLIDTEWQSDWKWDRLKNNISPLDNRKVLDIGCGNGYHLWRMKSQGARLVLGVDPSLLFLCQFAAINKYVKEQDVFLLPIKMESLPVNTDYFDTVFSMGVLYHRKSPINYLKELFSQLRKGGELVLETLVIDGDETAVLVPEGRYARMRNVWFIPSSAALSVWLRRVGFQDVRVVDESVTSVQEQRSTAWMSYESLAQSLNPDDHSLTIENYPAPKRAVLVAIRP